MLKKPELLSPAGTMEALKAAVSAGCDAVYFGGKDFSARKLAGNFSMDEIEEAIDYCKLRGVKSYITINTIYKEKEIEELLKFVSEVHSYGADAFIVQDIGAANAIIKNIKNIQVHGSTQMTIFDKDGANFLKNIGMHRVVLARELNLPQIKDIAIHSDIEVECFVHGALCVSYSGQCLMSSMLGGRSGNRGNCAQTCRLPYKLMHKGKSYKEGYLLSTKDLQTIDFIDELISSGITSFKIEGRMKSPEYVYGVTSIYRKYIDKCINGEKLEVSEEDHRILLQLFNRGGFTKGYYKHHGGKAMMSVIKPKSIGVLAGEVLKYDKRTTKCIIKTFTDFMPGDGIEIWTKKEPHVGIGISKKSPAGENIYVMLEGDIEEGDMVYKSFDKELMDLYKVKAKEDSKKQEIKGTFTAKKDEPICLKVSLGDISVISEGGICQAAQKAPITAEEIRKQLEKTGNTPFVFNELNVFADDNIFLPIKELNEIRRNALLDLEGEIIIENKKKKEKIHYNFPEKVPFIEEKRLTISLRTVEQFNIALNSRVSVIYMEYCKELIESLDTLCKSARERNIDFYVALPRIHFDEISYDILEKSDIKGYLIRTYGQLYALKRSVKQKNADYSFHISNNEGMRFLNEQGIDIVTLSVEQSLAEISHFAPLASEMVVYGKIPLMITNQCVVSDKESGKYCEKRFGTENYYLEDRKNMHFPILRDCDNCIMYILNSRPIFILHMMEHMLKSPSKDFRLDITIENGKELSDIIKYHENMILDFNKDAETKAFIDNMIEEGITKGYYLGK